MQQSPLLDKFHEMEIAFSLFESENYFWDIIRKDVYYKYYYPKDSLERSANFYIFQKIRRLIFILFATVKLIIFCFRYKHKDLCITCSRTKGLDGKYYDISAYPFFQRDKNLIAVENYSTSNTRYPIIYNCSSLIKFFIKKNIFPRSEYNKINNALIKTFGFSTINYDEIDNIYRHYVANYKYYCFLIQKCKPKKIIICVGNEKSVIKLAKENNIPCFLVQHASIEKEYIEFNYSKEITFNSNILFAETVCLFSLIWSNNINLPTKKIIEIGNNEMSIFKENDLDNSFLVVSTIVHGVALKEIIKQIAANFYDKIIIFKLHPNEFHLKSEYINYFKEHKNIKVISNEIPTAVLISKSSLLIAIISTVIYEALNQNKRVAIYKKLDYGNQIALKSNNVFTFSSFHEFKIKYNQTIHPISEKYFIPENDVLYNSIINS